MSPTGASALKVAAIAVCLGLVLLSMRQPVFAQTQSQQQACTTTCASACNIVAKAACPGFCAGNPTPTNPLACNACNTTANADCNNQCAPACFLNPDPNA
ncbi:hypothetical protein SEVIR_3G319400v4 [Setaria viridis]|uniref:Uncharacterized protein n=1 Tax=Setaria viridis TaxID=4556 RepID=A0A4U6VFH4_SETVI|nr:hypothetical protein SEVIR_3G319400v2 [Setaria viridis]